MRRNYRLRNAYSARGRGLYTASVLIVARSLQLGRPVPQIADSKLAALFYPAEIFSVLIHHRPCWYSEDQSSQQCASGNIIPQGKNKAHYRCYHRHILHHNGQKQGHGKKAEEAPWAVGQSHTAQASKALTAPETKKNRKHMPYHTG